MNLKSVINRSSLNIMYDFLAAFFCLRLNILLRMGGRVVDPNPSGASTVKIKFVRAKNFTF